jgi:hypothetical protein
LATLLTTAILVPVGYGLFEVAGAIAAVVMSQLLVIPITLAYSARHNLLNPKSELAALPAILPGALLGLALTQLVS